MTVRKWFWVWDFDKEESWLNEMAMQGWALARVGFCTYHFTACQPGECVIRLEMRPRDEAYISFVEETGAVYIGRVAQWMYFRRKAEDGPFDLFSDIDSRIAHLGRVGRLLSILGAANLLIGIANSLGPSRLGWINLLCATLLMYGLGRIHGKREALEKEKLVHE